MTGTPIQRRGRALIGLLLAASAFGAGPANAQSETTEPTEQRPVATQSAPSTSGEAPAAKPAGQAAPSQNGAQSGAQKAAPKSAAGPTSSNIEERVVLAGESDAVADFSSSDSVTGFNASDLEAAGAFSVADIAKFTPNLEIVTAGQTSPTFFIRGVGLNDFNSNSSGAVAVYQDDVPINSPALQLGTLFDMEQVNVQRGPQGTGPYRNASAGAIKLYSKKPSGNYSAFLKTSYGNYNAVDVEGAVEAPIVEDVISSRFAFRLSQRDGFATNGCGNAPPFDQRGVRPRIGGTATDPQWSICGEDVIALGKPDPQNNNLPSDGKSRIPVGLPRHINDQGNWAARGTFLFEPTLDMEWLLTVQGQRRDEQSRLGQSAGTIGTYCDPNQSFAACTTGTRPGRIIGLLGGPDAGGYSEPDIRSMFQKRFDELIAQCTPCTYEQQQMATNTANVLTANAVAHNLDSRPWRGDYDHVGHTTNDTYGLALKGDMVLPADLSFTTVTGFDAYNRTIDIDLDFTPNVLFEILTRDHAYQATQSFALTGDLFANTDMMNPVNWELGAFGLIESLHVKINNNFGDQSSFQVSDRRYVQDLYSAAAYFSFTWDFWDDFTLDGGARYNWERKTMDYALGRNGVSITDNPAESWSAPTGTIRLTYRFREDTHAFWKYTHGWKGGHFNATSSLVTGVTSAKPENIDAWETGVRGSWLDGRFALDGQMFYYSYKDYQIFTIQQQLGGQPEFVVLNANTTRVYGAELDAQIRPWQGAYIQARFSWLESTFLDFTQVQLTRKNIVTNGQQGFIIVKRELQNTGNPTLNSPRFKFSVSAEQTLPLGRYGTLTGRYDGAWTDDTYYDATAGRGIPNAAGQKFLPTNTIGQKAYWLHNLRLAYKTPDGKIELAGWVRNLTNQPYKTFAFDGSTFQNIVIAFVGDPRTFGATLTIEF